MSDVIEKYSQPPQGEKIGGLLYLIAIGMIINPLLILNESYDILEAARRVNWDLLWQRGPATITFLVFNFAKQAYLLIFSIALAILFFDKDYRFPKLIIVFLASLFLLELIGFLFLVSFIPSIDNKAAVESLKHTIYLFFLGIIWIPYFLKSVRVKRTFIKPTVHTPLEISNQEAAAVEISKDTKEPRPEILVSNEEKSKRESYPKFLNHLRTAKGRFFYSLIPSLLLVTFIVVGELSERQVYKVPAEEAPSRGIDRPTLPDQSTEEDWLARAAKEYEKITEESAREFLQARAEERKRLSELPLVLRVVEKHDDELFGALFLLIGIFIILSIINFSIRKIAPNWKVRKNLRLWCFGSVFWLIGVIIFVVFFEVYGSRMNDDEIIEFFMILLVPPLFIGSAMYTYEKYIK